MTELDVFASGREEPVLTRRELDRFGGELGRFGQDLHVCVTAEAFLHKLPVVE